MIGMPSGRLHFKQKSYKNKSEQNFKKMPISKENNVSFHQDNKLLLTQESLVVSPV